MEQVLLCSKMFAQDTVMGGVLPLVIGQERICRVATVGDSFSLWKVNGHVGTGWYDGHDGEPMTVSFVM